MTDDYPSLEVPAPKKRHMLTEGRALLELGATSLLMPVLMRAPKGDGHPVMVLPGFLANDSSTLPMRRFLRLKGYYTKGWGLGRNLGKEIIGGKQMISDALLNQVLKLSLDREQQVSLVGWSLGGILAREISRIIPDCVRQVISLGSPFNGLQGSAPTAGRVFKILNGHLTPQEPELVQRLIAPLSVPSTAIFSRSDGVAHWQACVDKAHHPYAKTENIEVKGSHLGLGHNAQVLWVVANRLAQQPGHWQPFRQHGWHRLLFPDPDRGES